MKYIVLLRGINAGKQRRVAMSDLRAQLADIGCREVATYLATGNTFDAVLRMVQTNTAVGRG